MRKRGNGDAHTRMSGDHSRRGRCDRLHGDDGDFAVRLAREGRRVNAEQFAFPPPAGFTLGLQACEPILVDYGANFFRTISAERILAKELEYIGIIRKQTLFGPDNESVLRPRAERGEPQIPFKARLIRRIDAGRGMGILRLIAERVWRPGLSILRSLKFDFVTRVSHYGKEAVLVGDAKWLQRLDWRFWQRHAWSKHPDQFRGSNVEDP